MDRCDAQDAQLQTRIVIVDDQSTAASISEKSIRNHTAALPQNFQKTCRALTAYLDGKPQTR
ncbi:hypothetical protein H7F10_10130 [Acidithiobacillus sp. HP-6]|uniref:hypothetical protein n=1 Tax=unclassified Acidithiobacillus TaxID=2614800 RepID=UPI0018795B10|nr:MULTISPECIES: hypothetical protein [unclassified Acidithiobacillus]MBE7563296.1 hypothetical protein [Acidithiobacillus sp. HP-6]MBE7571068.1 hypothetical protein [Acidithiobacillus sp. HP-2]